MEKVTAIVRGKQKNNRTVTWSEPGLSFPKRSQKPLLRKSGHSGKSHEAGLTTGGVSGGSTDECPVATQ